MNHYRGISLLPLLYLSVLCFVGSEILFAAQNVNNFYHIQNSLVQQNNHVDSGADRDNNVSATVFDHLGFPNDSATVYFISTQWDTSIAVGTDIAGIASTEIDTGLWSVYAHNNSDNGTYIDLWDGGVFQVTSDGMVDNVELYLYPRSEYGFLIASMRTSYNGEIMDYIPMAGVMIEDSTGNTVYYGSTNVWGDIGTPLLPDQEYTVIVSSDGEFQEQSIYIDTTDTYYELMFLFEDEDGGGGGDDSSHFDYEIVGFDYMGHFSGHHYFSSYDSVSWQSASYYVDTMYVENATDLHMVTISSAQENNFIQNSFDTTMWNTNSAWIGLTDEVEEGVWFWVNGEELTYTNWNGGEPNNSGGNEHYAELSSSSGLWNDLPNNYSRAFIIEVEFENNDGTEPAIILSVEDIPDDQGGRVYINFERSIYDDGDLGSTEMYTVERLDGGQWIGLSSVGAYGSDLYTVEATTLSDSTSDSDGITTYRIIANMDEGNFESAPVDGYSVDNIAPGLVMGLSGSYADNYIYLSWDQSEDNDFSHYLLYHSFNSEFIPDEENILVSTVSSYFNHNTNETGEYYYIISAVDEHGNEGDYSEVVDVLVLGEIRNDIVPDTYILKQNYPNPFNPETVVNYALPNSDNVNITIYDIYGRNIKSLFRGLQGPGYYSVRWDGTDHFGKTVSAGMYIYMIHAGEFKSVKKMILLK